MESCSAHASNYAFNHSLTKHGKKSSQWMCNYFTCQRKTCWLLYYHRCFIITALHFWSQIRDASLKLLFGHWRRIYQTKYFYRSTGIRRPFRELPHASFDLNFQMKLFVRLRLKIFLLLNDISSLCKALW